MGNLIVVDCEAPFGVGASSVGDMTEFGAVDVNALRDERVETFHGVDCSEDADPGHVAHRRAWVRVRWRGVRRFIRVCASILPHGIDH